MWRKGKKRSDEKPIGGESDGAPPLKRFAKGDSEEDGIVFCELSKSRRVSVKSWQGKIQVDIREFYMKDGQQLPGKKSVHSRVEDVNMSIFVEKEEQWTLLIYVTFGSSESFTLSERKLRRSWQL